MSNLELGLLELLRLLRVEVEVIRGGMEVLGALREGIEALGVIREGTGDLGVIKEVSLGARRCQN